MKNQIERSLFGKIMDTIFFPLRALFMGTEGKFSLSSLRDERMRIVANFCKGKVLDVGCGPGNIFINEFIGREKGIGIDIFPYKGVEVCVDDMTNIPFDSSSFDTITLIAVGGHIPISQRKSEFGEFSRLLKPEGFLLLTEGGPVTQFLDHKWRAFFLGLQGKLDLDSERGREEGEEYCMPLEELLSYLNTPPLKFIKRKRFITQWGLNSVYISKKLSN